MRTFKVFAVAFFICSLILVSVNYLAERNNSDEIWISAEQDEVTVSVNDDRAVWQDGITAGVGDDASLNDRIHLTHVGNMDGEGRVKATYTVIDDKGRMASLERTVCFSDYTPPALTLLCPARCSIGTPFVLSDLIVVTDPIDGDITDLVKIVRSDLDVAKAGEYEMLLTVETSCGIKADYTLTITVE